MRLFILLTLLFLSLTAHADPFQVEDALKLLPPDTQSVLMLNVTRMQKSELWKRIVALKLDKSAFNLSEDCGVDPISGSQSVVVALSSGGGEHSDFALLARGKFVAAKLLECLKTAAKAHNWKIRPYHGKTMFIAAQERNGAGAILDDSTAVFGSLPWVRRILDLSKRGGRSAQGNESLQGLVKQVDTSLAAWAVGALSDIKRSALRARMQSALLANARNLRAQLSLDEGFSAQVALETGNDGEAKSLLDELTKELESVRRSPQLQILGLSAYLDGVKLTQQAATLNGAIHLSDRQVGELLDRARGFLEMANPSPVGSSGVAK